MKFDNEILRKSGFLDDYFCPSINSLKKSRDNISREIISIEELLTFIVECKNKELKTCVIELVEISYSINSVEGVFQYISSKLKKLKKYHSIINTVIEEGNNITYGNLSVLYKIMNEYKEEEKHAKYFTRA